MSLDIYLESSDPSFWWSANVTHNLGKMAAAAGIYEAMWRPEELLDSATAAVMHDAEEQYGYHDERTVALRTQLEAVQAKARDLIAPLTKGLELLKAEPARFEALNPSNGWGSYEHFVPLVERYLNACMACPTANVRVSR